MFFRKCKKCGGKKVSVDADIEGELNGILQNATNVPAKQCVECGDVVVNTIILERLERYARDYPANNLDYRKCEDEESVASQTLL